MKNLMPQRQHSSLNLLLKMEMIMSEDRSYRYGERDFTLTKEEYEFTERNDLWDALSHMCHEWNINEDPEAWDLMMELYIPFFSIKGEIE